AAHPAGVCAPASIGASASGAATSTATTGATKRDRRTRIPPIHGRTGTRRTTRTTPPPPKPRSALAALPVYKPGRSAEVAMADHALDEAVKLASNENPFSPLPSV